MKTATYTLPAWWASYLINGDSSSLTDKETKSIDKWLASEGNPNFVDCSEEESFSWSACPITGLGGGVLDYTAIIEDTK